MIAGLSKYECYGSLVGTLVGESAAIGPWELHVVGGKQLCGEDVSLIHAIFRYK